MSHGTKTPIAQGFNKQSLSVRLATPVIKTYDRIFNKKDTGKEIQPKPVIGASMFGSSHKEVTRAGKLGTLQDRSEHLVHQLQDSALLQKSLLNKLKERVLHVH